MYEEYVGIVLLQNLQYCLTYYIISAMTFNSFWQLSPQASAASSASIDATLLSRGHPCRPSAAVKTWTLLYLCSLAFTPLAGS